MALTYEDYILLIKNNIKLTADEYTEFVSLASNKLDKLLVENQKVLERLKNK